MGFKRFIANLAVSQVHRIEVAFSDEKLDSAGISAKSDIEEDLGIEGITQVRFSELYYLDLPLEDSQIAEIAEKVFTDPIVQEARVDMEIFDEYDFCIEVRLHPDVTDNLGITAQEAIEDYIGMETTGSVRSARRYYITGGISKLQAEIICRKLLANEIIETFTVVEKHG